MIIILDSRKKKFLLQFQNLFFFQIEDFICVYGVLWINGIFIEWIMGLKY